MKKKKKLSLRTGFLAIIVLCWLIPILIIMSLAAYLLGMSYQESAEQEVNDGAEYAIRQVMIQIDEAIQDSKGVSYDGVVRDAYRTYQEKGDSAELYRSMNTYLIQQFYRSPQYKAVFIDIWNPEIDGDVYLLGDGIKGTDLLTECKNVNPRIYDIMKDADTDIRVMIMGGNLYLSRNLLDSHFEPYATFVIMLNPQVVFESLNSLNRVHSAQIGIDDLAFSIEKNGHITERNPNFAKSADICCSKDVSGHTVCFAANLSEYNLLEENPWLAWVALAVALMVVPLLLGVIALFQHHVTRPMETLVEAHQKVQAGERGYTITEKPNNAEFEKLFTHFNDMSVELKNQFERSYLEQQASQKAQIKALQSQINPHFLNNTLEIINWEARLAGNDRISAMIEALSTMLGAALDRKGKPQIPLKEELGYVDAYLYIIHERVGDEFHVFKEIDPDAEEELIPRLILQPIVENAVEHDITRHHGGNLWVRAKKEDGHMILEVEHDGTMTEEDRENVRKILTDDASFPRVGLQNVNQRMKLIYGTNGLVRVTETDHGTILAQIQFPVWSEKVTER